jgi:pilus assembly protein FimV
LNEPLVAEIELLAATPEELENLTIQLSSQETFERYDLDRPMFLSRLRFRLIRSGGVDGNIVSITSEEPVTEPFITFLVEAVWTRGRLLREYTLLLDPPTFAPPPVTQSTQAVTAPTRAAQTDSGQIQRPAQQQAAPTPAPVPQDVVRAPSPAAETEPDAAAAALDEPLPLPSEPDFDTTAPGDLVIQRGDTAISTSCPQARP